MNPIATLPTAILLAYLGAAVLFIIGIKFLSSPATARSGNLIAALGMAVAIVATLLVPGLGNLGLIFAALAGGLVVGIVGARVVQMTQMPQMVALLNGLGGGGAAAVAAAEFIRSTQPGESLTGAATIGMVFGAVVGTVAFAGSLVAFGKLQGFLNEGAFNSRLVKGVNLLLALAIVVLAVVVEIGMGGTGAFVLLVTASLLFGLLIVVPIGGADMPVVISLLNSCTGLAAASTGFVLHNVALIIGGTLVGASGALLTSLMCKAMNRSLANVLFAGVGAVPSADGAKAVAGAAAAGRTAKDIGVEDAAVLLSNIQSLVIIPGYGMAVAQAQHAVRELADMLIERGVDVRYAVHPVAGRMPGHMNVLLAEANVPYTQLFDLEQINPDFEHTDVALVIGANDVVNPAARSDRQSPIYGMPILDADKAHHVIIIKRSLNPGFAGIDNAIYYHTNTYMLFGDARKAVSRLVSTLRNGYS